MAREKKPSKTLSQWGIDLPMIVTKVIDERDTSRPDDGYFHSSSINKCSRSVYFNKVLGKPDNKKAKFPPTAKMAMHLGHSIHDLLQEALHQATDIEFEDEIPLVSKPDLLAGTCDGVVTFTNNDGERDKLIIEIKSTNSTWYNDKFIYAPKPEHYMQLQTYMYMSGIHKGIILYFNKDNARMATHDIEYDEPYIEKVLRKLHYTTECVTNESTPTMFLSCKDTTRLDKQCANYLRCKNFETGKPVE